MKDIYQIRRENLRRIIDDRFKDKRNALAELLGFSQASLLSRYLSQKKGQSKNIGPSLARKIEAKVKLPTGWMDTAQVPGVSDVSRDSYDLVTDAEVAVAAEKFRALSLPFREYILLKMDELQRYNDKLSVFVRSNLRAPSKEGYYDWERELEADMARLKIKDGVSEKQ